MSIYLMMCGMSLSGKTYLAKKIVEKYPKKFFVLDSRSTHDYLNHFEIFQDDNSVDGPSFKLRQEATDHVQKSLISVVSKNGFSILHDSCNRKLDERKERFGLVKSLNEEIKTVIIYVNPSIEIIKQRAQKEDQALIEAKRNPVWIELFNKQLESFDIPSKIESDLFFEYNGENEQELMKYLGNILNT